MFNLKKGIEGVVLSKRAIGHFNISNFEMLKAVLLAGQELSKGKGEKIPLIIGLSESERKFIGSKEVVAFIKSWREENNYPLFVNADHCRSFESVKEAGEAGFDSIVIDNSEFSLEENIEKTKSAVFYIKENYPSIVLEGELGVIGKHSALLDEVPENAEIADGQMTTVDDAVRFVQKTGVDCLAPAVGNFHGMLKSADNPNLDIERIKEIIEGVKAPLVLHGGSGITDEDLKASVLAGMSIIHISSELRQAYSLGVQDLAKDFFVDNPDEIAPYKIMSPVIDKMKAVVARKLELLN